MTYDRYEPRIGEYIRDQPCNIVWPDYREHGTSGTTITTDSTNIKSSPTVPVVAQGWQCPICKTIYAPHIDYCVGQHE